MVGTDKVVVVAMVEIKKARTTTITTTGIEVTEVTVVTVAMAVTVVRVADKEETNGMTKATASLPPSKSSRRCSACMGLKLMKV